jgi:hypothetical protein
LGGEELLILIIGGKRENTLNDNDTFEGMKTNTGNFSKLEIFKKNSSSISSFITQLIFYLGAKFRI